MRLKELREERNFTQKQIGDAIMSDQSNVARWEKGINQPSAEFIIRLADFFGVSTDYLLGRSDDFGNIVLPTNSPTVPALSDEERQLLDLFSRMDRAQKIQALGYCEGLISVKTGAHYPNFKA